MTTDATAHGRGQRVLVTGASGMLGRGIAQALIDRGDTVTVLQRRPSGLDCAEVLGDVADADADVADAAADMDAAADDDLMDQALPARS